MPEGGGGEGGGGGGGRDVTGALPPPLSLSLSLSLSFFLFLSFSPVNALYWSFLEPRGDLMIPGPFFRIDFNSIFDGYFFFFLKHPLWLWMAVYHQIMINIHIFQFLDYCYYCYWNEWDGWGGGGKGGREEMR